MINWTYEDPRLNPEQQEMLSQLPLTKAFLASSLDKKIWVAGIAPELEKIRRKFEGNEKTYYAITETLAFFALNSKVVNPHLPDEAIRHGQEILIALGFEAFLQKVDIKKYGPISTLIMSKLREIGLINEDALREKKEEILDWYDSSWKIGYNLLPLIIRQSPLNDRTTDQPPPEDSKNLGPFADFIKGLDF